ncbi:chorismate mutase [Bacillus sp. FJAT-50079]|uniref:chorismate mutase n=1 Tax=Bacillus sp. FJAT-50079 TaxID=2833577 RepID=UPI001BC983F8|nr:chorismate mutase [Bacillus sp. FJAT-50079]MBS4207283.1 chorismate mutase [Bacillus sp. FJAT-50079]
MMRMPFEPPTTHYDERITAIDEQICHLIKQRKELSNDNPGFPSKQLIKKWAKKYGFYEEFLNSIFADFLNEELYKPMVEPKGFLKNVPILRSFEKEDTFFSVTFVRQFENASVVHLNIDRNTHDEMINWPPQEHRYFELSIEREGMEYDCRNAGGSGSGGHESYSFVVSPALSDDLSTYKLNFKEYKMPFNQTTSFEFQI